MEESAIERKLDLIASILKLANKEGLDKVREAVRSEPGKAAILDVSGDWTAVGLLMKTVAQKSKKSQRSVQNYVSELLDLGVLEKRGAGRSIEYRSTGVI